MDSYGSANTNSNGWYRDRNRILEKLKDAINAEYGFMSGWPRINLGPCGSFAKLFRESWIRWIDEEVHIVFVMDPKWCRHVSVKLPDGDLYDGGFGVMTEGDIHRKFAEVCPVVLETMAIYDERLLEQRSYGWVKHYRRCPHYSWSTTKRIIDDHLSVLSRAAGTIERTPAKNSTEKCQ
jgi:hypothetical protein